MDQSEETVVPGSGEAGEELTDEAFASLMERLTAEAFIPKSMSYVPFPFGEHGEETGDVAAWSNEKNARENLFHTADDLWPYYLDMMQTFLSSEEENRVVSPVNVFFALAILAEITDGDTRAEILDELNADSLETIRKEAEAVFAVNSADDGRYISLLSASVWLSDRCRYREETLKNLADIYHASAFSGTMGSDEYNRALQEWLNRGTRGLLKEQAVNMKMPATTLLALATTIYLKAGWDEAFTEALNTEETFHGASGEEAAVFMHRTKKGAVYEGAHFTAACLPVGTSGAYMWFVLPKEGTMPADLLKDPEALEFLRKQHSYETYEEGEVVWSMPQFDVASDLNLCEGLMEMGILKVFDSAESDFSPVFVDKRDAYVSKAQHAARVTVDEEGVEAAAFTVVFLGESWEEPAERRILFTFDRPFLFMVAGPDGAPLFAGTVNSVS